jgi:hypothetical protein
MTVRKKKEARRTRSSNYVHAPPIAVNSEFRFAIFQISRISRISSDFVISGFPAFLSGRTRSVEREFTDDLVVPLGCFVAIEAEEQVPEV